jgi:CTP synthase (UTP-ammonia lyase)
MGSQTIRLGILGDFNLEYRSHHATNAAVEHAAHALGQKVETTWVPTPSLLEQKAVEALASYDALWASPGSPYRCMEGMLAGIQFARARNRPFVAT